MREVCTVVLAINACWLAYLACQFACRRSIAWSALMWVGCAFAIYALLGVL